MNKVRKKEPRDNNINKLIDIDDIFNMSEINSTISHDNPIKKDNTNKIIIDLLQDDEIDDIDDYEEDDIEDDDDNKDNLVSNSICDESEKNKRRIALQIDANKLLKCNKCKKEKSMIEFISDSRIACVTKMCQKCRDDCKKKDKSPRRKITRKICKQNKIAAELSQNKKDDNTNNTNQNKLQKCSNCKKEKSMENFISDGKVEAITKTCQKCRDKGKRKDKSKTRIASRALWKKNNPEKAVEYDMRSRNKKITNNIVGYLAKNNERMKEYRKTHPEYQTKMNEQRKVNQDIRYKYYLSSAKKRGIEFTLTKEEALAYFMKDCYYCGKKADINLSLNGIDRLDSTKAYQTDNCVTACEMCNMLKGSNLLNDEFINIVAHIITHLGVYNIGKKDELFKNSGSFTYIGCSSSADKRKIEFKLTDDEFYRIVSNNCYLCGKPNSDLHINGIDRIDSKLGYTRDNCKSCCSTCNYIKNSYNLKELLSKFIDILKTHKGINSDFTNIIDEKILLLSKSYDFMKLIDIAKIKKNRHITIKKRRYMEKEKNNRRSGNPNKMSKEELKEINEKRKVEKKENLIKRYTDPELIEDHIKEIAAKKVTKNE